LKDSLLVETPLTSANLLLLLHGSACAIVTARSDVRDRSIDQATGTGEFFQTILLTLQVEDHISLAIRIADSN
jgi:hypothetical protein